MLGINYLGRSRLYLRGPATVWNKRNPLIRLPGKQDWAWSKEQVLRVEDPLTIKGEILSNRGRAIAWALMFLESLNQEIWEALPERDPSFLITL